YPKIHSKFFKSVKSLLVRHQSSNRKHSRQSVSQPYAKEGVAVTLTTEFSTHKSNVPVTLIQHQSSQLTMVPCQPMLPTSTLEQKAYVHYEPKKAQISLGTNPDTKKKQHYHYSLRLTVEQYAWLVQQLEEEEHVHGWISDQFRQNQLTLSPMLGVSPTIKEDPRSIKRRLIRFVQRGNHSPYRVAHQCIFMLPKALVLQASDYIPMTKPLPTELPVRHVLPFEPIQDALAVRTRRYCERVRLCTHELVIQEQHQRNEPSPPCSFVQTKQTELATIVCAECLKETGLSTVYQKTKKNLMASSVTARLCSSSHVQHQQSIMFPVSFIQYDSIKHAIAVAQNLNQQLPSKEPKFVSSAIQPSSYKKMLFDSIARQEKPHAYSAFQYIPPDRTMSSSDISSISACSALDNEHTEIIVVFPGMTVSHHMFDNASFVPVPWLEIETIGDVSQQQDPLSEGDMSPWVLECALTAWRRCEMKVVTLLMRLCSSLPSYYKVVIIGHSLGGAVAALCASSLRSTRLLMDRDITVCAIHSPRVGNKSFLRTLSFQKVETIRITKQTDIMAHLPPRTSGLLHVGDTTIVLQDKGYVLTNMSLEHIENVLNKACSMIDFNAESQTTAWDITLDHDEQHCI
ncbi:hypothetical protein CU098_001353, partial [Rhizopus stolonifer]